MPVRLGELAARFGCELRGDPDTLIERVATLQEAGAGAISCMAAGMRYGYARAFWNIVGLQFGILFVLLIVVLLFRPQGLFPARGLKERI